MQVGELSASFAAPNGSTTVSAPQEPRDVEKVEASRGDDAQARRAEQAARAESSVPVDENRGRTVDTSA